MKQSTKHARMEVPGAEGACPIGPAALTQAQASVYLGLEAKSRWLDDAPIAWVDMRKPGSARPVKRWRRVDLDAFLAGRLVNPGFPSPFD